MTNRRYTSPPEEIKTVTIEEIIALTQKIGEEIWGKEKFAELMRAAEETDSAEENPDSSTL